MFVYLAMTTYPRMLGHRRVQYASMANDRNRAGVYDRESKGKGSSIEDQNRENLAACEANGWSVAVRYLDKVGASRQSKKQRDGWPKVIEDVTAGRIDVLVVWEIARADRTMDTWVPFVSACAEHGVLLHITSLEMAYDPRKASHRKALLDMGSTAEAETGQLSERSLKGIRGAALAGKPHGRSAWGYTRKYGAIVDGKRTFTEVPNEHAKIVKEIIERVARADPIIRICADLNERGVATPDGCPEWHRNSLRQVAMRPTYAGLRGHNYRGPHGADDLLYQGDWPAIVSESVWRDAQAVLADPSRRTTQPGRYRWLLSYLAVSPCDGSLNGRPGREGRKSTYRCITDGCVGIGVMELDVFVTDLVLARLARPDVRAELVPDTSEVEAARVKVIRVRAELNELAEQLKLGPDNGGISAMLAAQAEPGIRQRLAEAERELSAISGRNGPLLALLGDGELTEDVLRPQWLTLSVAGRRAVIEALTERIELQPAEGRASRWMTDEDRVRLAAERTEVTWRV